MRYLIGIMVLFSLGCSTATKQIVDSPASTVTNFYSITGKANDGTGNASISQNIYLRIDADNVTSNGYLYQYLVASGAFSKSFSVSNVTENSYYIYVWKDINNNGTFGQFDSYQSPAVLINLNNNLNVGTLNMNIIW